MSVPAAAPALDEKNDITYDPSIDDTTLLSLIQSKRVKMVLTLVKPKAGAKDDQPSIYPSLMYTSGKPVLAKFGYIKSIARILFGARTKAERNKPGKFPKKNLDIDECKLVMGTKTSNYSHPILGNGCLGTLMLHFEEMFTAATHDFRKNPEANIPADAVLLPYPICKRELGSSDHPQPPDKQAEYQAKADWRFDLPFKFALKTVKRTIDLPEGKKQELTEQVSEPMFFEVHEFKRVGDDAVKVKIGINSDNVHEYFANGTVLEMCVTLGKITKVVDKTLNSQTMKQVPMHKYFFSINSRHNVIVEKPVRAMNATPDYDKAKRLAYAGAAAVEKQLTPEQQMAALAAQEEE